MPSKATPSPVDQVNADNDKLVNILNAAQNASAFDQVRTTLKLIPSLLANAGEAMDSKPAKAADDLMKWVEDHTTTLVLRDAKSLYDDLRLAIGNKYLRLDEDLSAAIQANLRTYERVAGGRPLRTRRSAPRSAPNAKAELQAIRGWAQSTGWTGSNGKSVTNRGRVSGEARAAWESAGSPM